MNIESGYKYCALTEYALENIREEKIAFTHISMLNDPAEAIVRMKFDDDTRAYFENIGMEDTLKNIELCEDAKSAIEKEFRILSLAKNECCQLMWAHYSAEHQGICIEYDMNDIYSISDDVCDIYYSDDIPTFKDDIKNILFHKSSEWKYEEEIRAIYHIKEADLIKSKFEECFNFLNHPERCSQKVLSDCNNQIIEAPKIVIKKCRIKNIYFGVKADKNSINQVKEIVKNKDIGIYKMRFMDNSYKMGSQRID